MVTFLKPHRDEVLAASTMSSNWAYYWEKNIGDRDHMRQFVTESEWAYYWARNIGDKKHMRKVVTEAYWAYLWARNIGDHKHMCQFVVGTEYEVRLDKMVM